MKKKNKSSITTTNSGQTLVVFDQYTKLNMAKILATSKEIFSAPLTDNQCLILLDTIIDMQLAYSDDIADLEDVIEATVDFFELFENRLKGGGKNE